MSEHYGPWLKCPACRPAQVFTGIVLLIAVAVLVWMLVS